jgi:histidinol-phosphate/aromatic aminotransferase/cobyric acid decarboxylase-like protein
MGNNEYYEQVLRVITTLDQHELKAFILTGQKWYEIDDIQDKDIAETIFSNTPEERLKLIGRRFGGYWRFPRLLDFCYLINPYFPTEQMLNELNAYFRDLLTEYPSGLNVQNLLAGKLFDIDEANILTGNGAAELIRAVSPLIEGSVGIVCPTFNEYPESFADAAAVKQFYPPGVPENMAYAVTDLIEWSAQCDTLLLINPDNPSGNYIPFNDVLNLLERMKPNNKRLILDESFIDFSDAEEERSLLQQKILNRFPNLIVIKSLSKSYGIPGIRLGILACGDSAVIAGIRQNIPIWNINSFAEYFLQIIGKYQKDYRLACQAIFDERRRFKAELENLSLFTVYPSQANYFLCRCAGNFSAQDLAKYLLEDHDIFIKDLTGKNGIPGGGWLRLSVRNRTDNNILIAKLKMFKERLKGCPET